MDRTAKVTFVTLVGSVVNIILTVFKIFAGVLGRSTAMIADGIHSLSDLLSDIVVIVFVKISAKGRDKDHDYGHGKFETFATLIISLMLIVVAVNLMSGGINKIRQILDGGEVSSPGMIALWAAVASIVLKEILYRYTIIQGKALNSPMMIANAWHHRSDAFSSVGSLLGIAGAIFLGDKFVILDPITGCVISIFILVMAVKMSVPAIKELLDVSLPDDVEEKIEATAKSVKGVVDLHELKTRREGPGIIMEGHLVLDSEISLKEAHDISKKVEESLRKEFGTETQISLHLEPEDDAE
jgi:cation diffusion facilitator family transporter|uniref:cation diffusion facilitator family transporter n=1 Tax=Candidatus Cryptobacteroides bacterium TaxID=3085639 RepID=UPI004026D92C